MLDDNGINDGGAFFANHTLDELARQQDIAGPVPFEQLLGGWPEAARNDGFNRALARWRRAGVGNGRSKR